MKDIQDIVNEINDLTTQKVRIETKISEIEKRKDKLQELLSKKNINAEDLEVIAKKLETEIVNEVNKLKSLNGSNGNNVRDEILDLM